MKNNENILMNNNHQIKVNKKPFSKTKDINLHQNNINSINFINEEIPTNSFTNKIIISNIRNKNIQKFPLQNVDNNNNIYGDNSNSLSSSYKDLNFRKINNNNIINNNQVRYTNYINKNHKNKKRLIEEDNGNKLLIYKSETQYPLSYRKNTFYINGYRSMSDLNYTRFKNDRNYRYSSISPKYKVDKIENLKKNKYISNKNINDVIDDNNIYNYENNRYQIKSRYTNYPMESFSYMTFNNFGDFYQPIKEQINNNTNYYYNNNENIYLNEMDYNTENIEDNNYVGYPQNIPYLSQTVNRRNRFDKDEYIQIFKRNNVNKPKNCKKSIYKKISPDNSNKNYSKDKGKENDLISVYKGKLIKIFFKFMNNFFKNRKKDIFDKLISELKKLDNIDKNYITVQNTGKSFSSHKKKFSLYKKINKKRNINNELNNLFINENEEILKKSASNLYIPIKNRITYNNYNNLIGLRAKLSIFNEIKIDKTNKLIDIENNNKNISPSKNNYYSTNYNEFYLKKTKSNNNYFNIGLEKNKIKYNLSPHSKQNENKKNINEKNNKGIKKQITFYKKVISKEKDNINHKKENKNNNINVYQKKNQKTNNIGNSSNFNNQKIMHRYTTTYNFNKNNFNSTIFKGNNNQNKNNEKNIDFNINNINNSINISHDTNNYCLDDKPMNILILKNNIYNNEDDISFRNEKEKKISKLNLFEDNNTYQQKNNIFFEIKNLIRTMTEDKKLSININYIAFNNPNKNKKKKVYNLVVSKNNSFKIISNKNMVIEKGIYILDNIILDKIYKNVNKFFINLKQTNSIIIINNLISKLFLKYYFNIFKKNMKTKYRKKINHVSFKDIDYIKYKKDSFNFLIDSNYTEINFINPKNINKLQGKEKLKFLIKQIYKDNNSNSNRENYNNEINDINDDNNNNNINTSFRDNNEKIDFKLPLWKSNDFKNINSNMKKQKSVYLKKNIKQKNINNW